MSWSRKCECSQEAHFHGTDGEPNALTPNGNPGHLYGAKYAAGYLYTFRTMYRLLVICKDCAQDCYREYNGSNV